MYSVVHMPIFLIIRHWKSKFMPQLQNANKWQSGQRYLVYEMSFMNLNTIGTKLGIVLKIDILMMHYEINMLDYMCK